MITLFLATMDRLYVLIGIAIYRLSIDGKVLIIAHHNDNEFFSGINSHAAL